MGCCASSESKDDDKVAPPRPSRPNAVNTTPSQLAPSPVLRQGSATPYSPTAPTPRSPISRRGSKDLNSKSNASFGPQPSFIPRTISEPMECRVFTYQELKAATKTFQSSNFLGEGGFGRVYRGRVESTGQLVAVKQLDREGSQGHAEFMTEVKMLSGLHHPNLVNLIGYCAEDDHRLLVYEFMSRGSLEHHLFRRNNNPLSWALRMKIALGAAMGLEYLHDDRGKPTVIYRDFKASNILLDQDYNVKLSDFGLAKNGPTGDKTHVSTRVMGTYGYCAPEYVMTGHLTSRSDVYSFGVVLLELITGRISMDKSRPTGEHNLVQWVCGAFDIVMIEGQAQPLLTDKRKLYKIMDPRLEGQYSIKGAQRAAALAEVCLRDNPKQRPLMSDVVQALTVLQEPSDLPAPTQPRHSYSGSQAAPSNSRPRSPSVGAIAAAGGFSKPTPSATARSALRTSIS